jgi:hypothetical protein
MRSGEYTIYTGRVGAELINLLCLPSTPEIEARLEELYAGIEADTRAREKKNKEAFILENGQSLYTFIDNLGVDWSSDKKSFYWEISSDENDDYWSVLFYKGEFSYIKDICGGYAGREVLEKNISKKRVVELLNSKK